MIILQERLAVRRARSAHRASTYSGSCFAPLGEFIFFVPPKKTNQKKSGPAAGPMAHPWSAMGFPVLLGKTGARPTRRSRYARFGLEQGARLPRFFLRCAAAPTGLNTATRLPWAPPSIAGLLGVSEPPCLSWPGYYPACELGERPKAREAQGTLIGIRQSGQAVGRPSLWVLSLGRARESTSPEGAKPTNQKELTPRPKWAKQKTIQVITATKPLQAWPTGFGTVA